MVEQKEVDLNKPLDANVDSVIRRVPLQPDLATVALTIHGDYYRQLQSKCNSRILWHPLTQLYAAIILLGFAVYTYGDLYEISDSFSEFLKLAIRHKYILTSFFPAIIFMAGSIGLASFMLTDEFRIISDSLANEAVMAKVFRFPLKIFAAARPEDMGTPFIKSALESTDFIEYRKSPIAIVTVIPMPSQSTADSFCAKVSGLHVRKSYRKAGLEEELLGYAIEKARTLCSKYVVDNKLKNANIKILLMADAYSVDSRLMEFYESHGFIRKSVTYKINPFTEDKKTGWQKKVLAICFRFFDIKRITFQLELTNSLTLDPETQKFSSATGFSGALDNIKKRKGRA